MNETIDVILHRRSVRSFQPEPLPRKTLNAILLAGCAAPHGGPAEPWRLVVIQKDETKRQLLVALKRGIDRACGGQPKDGYWCTFFVGAPVVVAVTFKPTSMRGPDERTELGIGVGSAACAIENMLIAAAALGLGACWVGPLPEAKAEFEELLGIKPPWEFLALVPIGRPDPQALARPAWNAQRREEARVFRELVQFVDE